MSSKICKNCQSPFEITETDESFYKKMGVPPPTQCPICRRQRKLAFRNERYLYHRKCDLCKKEVISVFTANSEYTVYCHECWWSDKWDPMSYGRNYDFNRSFFDQFSQLEKSVPHFALFQEGMSENCKYVNYGVGNKSCYLALCANCEDVYFSHGGIQSKSCMDCAKFIACELCYDCINCTKCYDLFFSKDCNNCSNSLFMEDCLSCNNCFCCSGQKNKQFCFENKQLSEETYKNKIAEFKLTGRIIEDWKKKLEILSAKMPKKYFHGISNQNVTGDYLDNCKNNENCFDCLNCEDIKNCDLGGNNHNLYDCVYAGGCESCYEINGAVGFNNCKFAYYGRFLQDTDYSQNCHNSAHLFGCFGLNHKKYCIFNKQYTKEEYEALVARITDQMTSTAEYGEFFPISTSSFSYNESVAHEYYPLTKQQALAKGYKWSEEENISKVPQTYKVPENIENVPDSVLNEVLSCQECQKNYKIISQEINFYRKLNLPIPESCYNCRHKARFNKRNPRQLWPRHCQKCQANIQTSYAPDRPEIVYCEKCYLETLA